MAALKTSMTLSEFDRGYWYAEQLKAFAQGLGLPRAARLRKDELERAIRDFLKTGRMRSPTSRSLEKAAVRDVDRGLRLALRVRQYTSNRETKAFLEREAQRMAPGLRRRSGARYRLNRWREEQLTRGIPITYRDLVKEYVRLSSSTEPFARIPHGRYINFLADFLASEPGATHAQARRAWKALKRLDVPKDYPSWKAATRP